MKKLICLLLFGSCFGWAMAQNQLLNSTSKLKPNKEYENIHVTPLNSDENSSAFVIWIKKEVRIHKHEWHSETVYVLKGKAQMQLGEQEFEVRKGDVIFIPEGTPHGVKVLKGPLKVISVQAPEFKGQDRVFLD